ncbi:MAG TPA: ATP-binding protein [Candidatus Binatia bacterium]|jgi:signal transduction histidine kinase|nr:ATP-binding protein [Candidatus Binatia bacterium]
MNMDATLVQTVRQTPLFAGLKDEHLDCIRSGEVIEVPAGATLIEENAPAEFFFLNLEGEIRISRRYDNQEVLLGVNKPGMFMGEIPLLLDAPWHAVVRVAKPARLFRLNREKFWRMLSTCHCVATEIFRTAANRLRNLEGYSHQRQKLVSLGTMAAGLAHELNNPAAAARRAAAQLHETISAAQSHVRQLAKTLQPAEWEQLLASEQDATHRLEAAPPLDSLTRSDREEALTQWLEAHGIPEAWRLAPVFVSAGLGCDWLAALTEKIQAGSRTAALNWLEARLNLQLLLKLVDQSTGRVADLVKAVKSYTYMDQSPMQEVDVHDGIESTLTMLGHKLKNVTLVRGFDRSAPRIMAYGSELNQVWTNLIDNAVDAVDGSGKICVGTFVEDNQLVVEIVDNGRGIPPETQARMFEPFFTTKGVGSGTGLGLLISNRIVADRHGGEIEFESKPGETRFKVRLPLVRTPAPGNPP